MITINLLPEAYRKPAGTPLQQLPRTPLALWGAGMLVGGTLLLSAVQGVEQHRFNHLRARIRQLEAQSRQATQLQQAVHTLQQQQAVYQRLDRERSRWARRLGALTELTPDGMWFSELSVEPSKGLTLQGAAVVQGGEEMTRIGRFVQDLKSHPEFAGLAQDIQVESIRRVQDGEIETVEFVVVGTP